MIDIDASCLIFFTRWRRECNLGVQKKSNPIKKNKKRFLEKIVDYMKSDSYMFSPFISTPLIASQDKLCLLLQVQLIIEKPSLLEKRLTSKRLQIDVSEGTGLCSYLTTVQPKSLIAESLLNNDALFILLLTDSKPAMPLTSVWKFKRLATNSLYKLKQLCFQVKDTSVLFEPWIRFDILAARTRIVLKLLSLVIYYVISEDMLGTLKKITMEVSTRKLTTKDNQSSTVETSNVTVEDQFSDLPEKCISGQQKFVHKRKQ
ncbi:hypothetical protein NC651_038842 [Populus alba x Populus x berolinensis]|nr:hypothetical protein NC651_038842 [Populus alba x Populus x berolinensis]